MRKFHAQGATQSKSASTYRPTRAAARVDHLSVRRQIGPQLGQGATQSSSLRSSTYCPLVGQGATEYLVLLAVVLIVALVSVALLGFFPGMASDAQITQSQTYWSSASPIAIVEMTTAGSLNVPDGSRSLPYLRLRNTGAYRITLTKVCGNNGDCATQYACAPNCNLSSMVNLAPGEEMYIGVPMSGLETRQIDFRIGGSASSGMTLYGLSSSCSPYAPYGTMVMKNFAFEYIEHIDGQQITKRQIGVKPLIAKCREPY